MKFIEVIFIIVTVFADTCRSGDTLNCCPGNDDSNNLLITKAQMDFMLKLLRHSSKADDHLQSFPQCL
uniref:Venom protein n=1 Tax=Loa loa TaxID=7209 RepID=A0A1I7W3X9_LOALO